MDNPRLIAPAPTSEPAAATSPKPRLLSRRAALVPLLLAPALSGCSWFDWLTDEAKKPIPGNRIPILAAVRGLQIDSLGPVSLPPIDRNPEWLQYYRTPAHVGGNLAGGLARAWSAGIGAGGDYRQRITAQPLVRDGVVYTMDADAAICAFDLQTGHRLWHTKTRPKKADSNIGGGIALYDGRLYAVTGRSQAMALDLADGHIIWHANTVAPARGTPTVAAEGIFFTTIDDELICLALHDGHVQWTYRATATNTGTIGQAAPAYADGVVVAGFESGDIAALRADSGTLIWSDNMGGIKGALSLSDFGSVRAAPIIRNGLVLAIGLGGLLATLDLRSGRRVWQRDVAGGHTPWVAGEFAYLLSTEQKLGAVSFADGTVHWVTDLPRFTNVKRSKGLINWTGPVMAGSKLILVSDHGKLAVVDPIAGGLITTTDLPSSASVPATVAQGMVLIVTDDGTLVGYK